MLPIVRDCLAITLSVALNRPLQVFRSDENLRHLGQGGRERMACRLDAD